MKRAIGCIAVYEDATKGRVALLQVRKAGDSYPKCVEKTWGGGAAEGERLSVAICREYGEELRECVDRTLGEGAPLPQSLVDLHREETSTVAVDEPLEEVVDQQKATYTLRRLNVLRQEGKMLVVTLLCQIQDPHLVADLQPMIDAGVLLLLTANELDRLTPISGEHKKAGLSEAQIQEGKLGMFPDEIEAVTKALKL